MSISYCGGCEQVVEGNTIMQHGSEHCGWCGEETSELPEDDPREDR